MTLKKVTPEQAEALRESLEAELWSATSRSMRSYLAEVAEAAQRDALLPHVLVAAGGGETPTYSWLASTWSSKVDQEIMAAVSSAFQRAYRRWTDVGLDMESPALSGMRQWVSNVRNRLVLGTHMGQTVYEDSFDRIRSSLALSISEGWSREELARRIGAELSWEKNGPYWRNQLSDVNKDIDDLLDPLGDPGNPVREYARLHDPRVNALQAERSKIVRRLDDEYSTWRTRANLIARTESTGAANYGSFTAMTVEGVATKVWVSTGDRRTRPSHRAASGQESALASPFFVGQALMMYPGDPSGPASEIVNCRCTMVAEEYLTSSDKSALKYIEEGGDIG